MSDLVFVDVETTGLKHDADIWEFAAIRRFQDGTAPAVQLFIEHDASKCARLPEAFRADHEARYGVDHLRRRTPGGINIFSRSQAARLIAQMLRGRPHIVGAVPNFDTEKLARLLREHGYSDQPWHHHLIDVENLAVGYLAAHGTEVLRPWDSDRLSMAIGVDPRQFERHTAMGDARWAMAIYDAVMTPVAVAQ